jgi:uncharacterized OB-fold protein
MSEYYLKSGLPRPAPARDGLDAPFWAGLREERLVIQRCGNCRRWQWGPEWLCHHCHSFDMKYEAVPPTGRIYSYERVWHPVHRALADQGPYVVVLIELPHVDNVRIIGNLMGDPRASLPIGAPVTAVFEHHADVQPEFTLLQWQLAS